jgi:hypothetical protein
MFLQVTATTAAVPAAAVPAAAQQQAGEASSPDAASQTATVQLKVQVLRSIDQVRCMPCQAMHNSRFRKAQLIDRLLGATLQQLLLVFNQSYSR